MNARCPILACHRRSLPPMKHSLRILLSSLPMGRRRSGGSTTKGGGAASSGSHASVFGRKASSSSSERASRMGAAKSAPYTAAAGDGGRRLRVGAGGGGGGAGQRQNGERFRVSESVKLVLHRGDITGWWVDGEADAIVNAANPRMLGGGGVDGAIHRKAGPQLMEACREVPQVAPGVRCPVGEARITSAFDLPVSKVIHTVGPIYDKVDNRAGLLGNAYRNSLELAIRNGIKYIAFPAISCGVHGYPPAEAAVISLSVIKEASNGLSEVHFVLFEQETYSWWMEEASKKFEHI